MEMEIITENDVNLQSTSGATNLEDPEQPPTLQTLNIKQIVERLTSDERIKEKFSDIDEDGSMTWLLLKLLHCPFTKRIFHKILIFYNLNGKSFRLILFSVYICCSFILFMGLFGYYRQIYLFDILFIGSFSNICNVIQLIMNFFYKSKYDCWLESSFIICYLLIIKVMLAVRFYYEEIFFDRISFFFIFLCTFLVLIYNFLMSLKYFKYMKYILPSFFFIILLFFSVFYKFKYYLIAYIVSVILCTFCNFWFRVFYTRPQRYLDILYGGLLLFYVYTFDLIIKAETANSAEKMIPGFKCSD